MTQELWTSDSEGYALATRDQFILVL